MAIGAGNELCKQMQAASWQHRCGQYLSLNGDQHAVTSCGIQTDCTKVLKIDKLS